MKIFKYLMLVIVLLILAVGGGVAYLTMAYPPEKLAQMIEKAADKNLPGADLRLGRLKVNFFPQIAIDIDNVAVTINGAAQPVFSAGHLGVDANYAALLSEDKIRIDKITLKAPHVHWRDDNVTAAFLAGLSGGAPKKAEKPASDAPAKPVEIGKIALTDGTIIFDKPDTNASLRFDALALTGSVTPQKIRGLLTFRHQDSNWTIGLPDLHLDGDKIDIKTFRFAIDAVALAGDIAVENTEVPKIDVDLTLSRIEAPFIDKMQAMAKGYQQIFAAEPAEETPQERNATAEQNGSMLPPLRLNARLRLEGVEYLTHQVDGFSGKFVVGNGKIGFSGGIRSLDGVRDVNATFIAEPDNNLAFKGAVKIPSGSPMPLLELAGMGDVNRSAGIWQRFALATHFEGDKSKVKIHDSVFMLDDTTVKFNTQVINSDNPLAVFDVRIDKFDANPYLASLETNATAEANATDANVTVAETEETNATDPLAQIRAFGKFRVGGQIKADSLTFKAYTIKTLLAKFTWKESKLKLDPFKMELFGGYFAGKYSADFAPEDPTFHIEHMIRKLKLQKLYDARNIKQKVGGTVDLTLRVDAVGATPDVLLQSLSGAAILQGRDVMLHGVDVDKMIETYQTAKYMQLADVALLLTTGPLGGIISMGARASYMAYNATQGGSTKLKKIMAAWAIQNGRARALDVAVQTELNRIAMRGVVGLAEKRLHNIQIGVLDANNCAVIKQTIDGPLESLSVDYMEASGDILLGSVDTLFDLGERAVRGCDVFYRGRL